jgi:hypothetical protein
VVSGWFQDGFRVWRLIVWGDDDSNDYNDIDFSRAGHVPGGRIEHDKNTMTSHLTLTTTTTPQHYPPHLRHPSHPHCRLCSHHPIPTPPLTPVLIPFVTLLLSTLRKCTLLHLISDIHSISSLYCTLPLLPPAARPILAFRYSGRQEVTQTCAASKIQINLEQ